MNLKITASLDLELGSFCGVEDAKADVRTLMTFVGIKEESETVVRHTETKDAIITEALRSPAFLSLVNALTQGGNIQAIKSLREMTGLGLMESKVFIEQTFGYSLERTIDARLADREKTRDNDAAARAYASD